MLRITVFCLLLSAMLGCSAKKKSSPTQGKDPQEVLDAVQVITEEGQVLPLNHWKGQKILLHFWATWCGPCRQELPDLAKASIDLQKDGWVVIALSNEDMALIKRYKQKTQFPLPFYGMASSLETTNVKVLPTTYVINSQFELRDILVGVQDWGSTSLIKKLEKH